jgi:Cu/Ag efflux pump CusA
MKKGVIIFIFIFIFGVILFDPIFQGLAISLVFGAIVSTLLTLIVIPLIYYMSEKNNWKQNEPVEPVVIEENLQN